MENINSEAFAFLSNESVPTSRGVAEQRAQRQSLEGRVLDFQKEAWKKAGVIKECREIEGHLLARIRISEEMKAMALDIDKSDEELMEIARGEEIPRIGKGREGIVLVLKGDKPGLKVMGEKHADKLEPDAVSTFYSEIVSKEEFGEMSEAIEGCLSESEERSDRLKSGDRNSKLRLVK